MAGGSSNSGTAAGLAQISGGNNTSTGSGGALQLIGGATVSATPGPIEFGFNGKLEPTLLHDPKSPDYRHVIMPLPPSLTAWW